MIATVVAAIYLMLPPTGDWSLVNSKGRMFNPDAPISRWTQAYTFDKAVNCESFLHDEKDRYERREPDVFAFAMVKDARCISSDDMRLRP